LLIKNILIVSFTKLHGKNGFAKVFKILVRYRSEDNFIRPLK